MLFDVDGTFMGEAEDEMPPTRLPCELVALPCSDELGASSEGEREGEGEGEGEGGGEGGADGEAVGDASLHDEAPMAPQPDIPIGARVSHPNLGVGEIVEKKKARQLGQIHGPGSPPCGNAAYSCLVPPPGGSTTPPGNHAHHPKAAPAAVSRCI